MATSFKKDLQYYKFCAYGFFKNLRFFDAFIILFFIEKDISFFQIGVLYSIREIIINIFEIPTGVIADTFGRRKSMVFSFSNYIIAFLILYLFSTYYLFIIAFIFYALGDAFRTGTHKAMIFEYLKINGWEKDKVHYYGHTRSWSQFGSAISSLFAAGIVVYSGNYNSIFLFSTIPYVIDLILMISYPRILDGEIQKFELKLIKHTFKEVVSKFITAIKDLFVLKAISNLAIYSGFYKAVKDYIQIIINALFIGAPILLYLDDKQRSAVFIGLVYFIIYAITSFFTRRSGKIAQRFPSLVQPMNITLLIGSIVGIIIGFCYHFHIYWIAVLFFMFVYILENIRKPIGIGCISTLFDKKVLATALSAESQVQTLFAALIAPLIGYIADIAGIGAGLIIISGIFILLYPILRINKQVF